jgi:hypothetical protein
MIPIVVGLGKIDKRGKAKTGQGIEIDRES